MKKKPVENPLPRVLPCCWDLQSGHKQDFAGSRASSLKDSVRHCLPDSFGKKLGLWSAILLLHLTSPDLPSDLQSHRACSLNPTGVLPHGINTHSPQASPSFLISSWCQACSCQGSVALRGHACVEFLFIAAWAPDSVS